MNDHSNLKNFCHSVIMIRYVFTVIPSYNNINNEINNCQNKLFKYI